jgi:type 1 fimbria pilin
MKQHLLALSLGLSAALAGTSAHANTGTINFEGKITASTCPIEVVNPEDDSIGNQVKMGTVEATRFKNVGEEFRGKKFGLRVTASAACGFDPADNTAIVTFSGTADTSGDYFAVGNTPADAKGVSISLRDHTGASIKPGAASAVYDLNDSGITDMIFNAYYRATAIPVEAGTASADVHFNVAIN